MSGVTCFCSACNRGEPEDCELPHWAERMRERGYLVLAPGDTSPVAELVREAVDWGVSEAGVLEAAEAVHCDPAVRAWAGRK